MKRVIKMHVDGCPNRLKKRWMDCVKVDMRSQGNRNNRWQSELEETDKLADRINKGHKVKDAKIVCALPDFIGMLQCKSYFFNG